MAKSNGAGRKGGPNRSDAIRAELAANPKATSREIMNKLAEKGIKVSSTLVYFVKSKMGKAKRRAKRAQAVEASTRLGSNNPVEVVSRVKDLARDVGGIRHLKKLVDLMAE
jgi:hypothetical protein